MDWTIQQKKAIEERGSSLLVSAAAGSGKTAVLVERIRRLVMKEGVGLDHMLVVTFTRAAAGEMKEKIYKSLSKALSEDPPAEQRRHLKRQLAIIGRADICTFDQFALEVVHRYYHVAALPPGIGVCDNGQGDIMRRETMDELLSARFAADDEAFLDFLTRYCSSKNNDGAREMIASFYDFLQSLPDPEAWMTDLCADEYDPQPLLKFAAGRVAQLLETALMYVDKAADMLAGLPHILSKLMESRSSVESALEAVKSDHRALSAVDLIKWTAMRTNKAEEAQYGLVKDKVSACLENAKKLCKKCAPYCGCSDDILRRERELLLPQVRVLCDLTRDFTARFLEKKLAKNVLDFSDIAHQAIRILENPDVASEYRNKFDYIFVDEYQDSNLVQDSLIQLIARPDNCFMVGDVKQSIYKFRQAEPELFLEKYNAFKAGLPVGIFNGRVIDLNHNFRSGSAVIDCVNKCFEKLMTPGSTGILYDEDAKLHEGVPYTGPLANKTELWIADSSADDTLEDEEIAELRAAELEALQAVGIIRKYHLNTFIKSDKHPDGRPLEYRDMVILMRGVKSRGEVFYQILSNAGIPVLLERGEGYFDTMEITVFLNLLRLIDNAKQDIPLLSVLHFPAFGFSSADLAAVRVFSNDRGWGRIPYNIAFENYADSGDDQALREKCSAFIKRLEDWRLRAIYTPLEDFLWELLTATGIDTFAASIPAGEQRRANLRALVDKARDYESRNVGGLHGFISYVEMITAKGGKVDIGQAKVLSEGTDAVRIMTIHKSKGLEFPFVMIAGTGGSFRFSQGAKLRCHKDYGAAFKIVSPSYPLNYEPGICKLLGEKNKADEMAEEIRVLYVAMTRPKDIMVITGAMKEPEKFLEGSVDIAGDVCSSNSYLDMLLPVIDRDQIHITSRAELAQMMNKVYVDKAALAESLEKGFDVKPDPDPVMSDAELYSRINFRCPTPAENETRQKYSVSELVMLARGGEYRPAYSKPASFPGDPLEARLPLFMQTAPSLNSAEKGTAYHKVMEHIPFTSEGKTPAEIRTFIEELCRRHVMSPAEAAAVDEKRIAAFFDSPTGRRAVAASRSLKRESNFTLAMDFNGCPILVQGTIDCCFMENGHWILVDYKSNFVDPDRREKAIEHLKENYMPQLALYRRALEEITGIPVSEGILYLFGIDEELRLI